MYSKVIQAKFFDQTKSFLKKGSAEEDYNKLVELLQYHEWKYYVESSPVISDTEYDLLYKQLENLEELNPSIVRVDSPTQRVSSDLSSNFPTVKHLNPMLSLANSYNAEDLRDFDTQIKKLCRIDEGEVAYFIEPKLDGGSIALVYENDMLIRSATRGNGTEGEEMTANAKAIPSVPLSAKFSEFNIYRAELRGEAVIALDNFKRINAQREEEGLVLFANPRNAATGGLRIKDASETRKRGLEVMIFQLAYAEDENGNNVLDQFGTHAEAMKALDQLGFKIPKDIDQLANNIEEAAVKCAELETSRPNYNYEIDGAVVKVNSFELQERCGSTQHHPRWAIAFKFKAKQATTTLESVEFQVGKTGAITPVAKVEPVHLAGVTVSSISMHNEDFIKQKDLRIGDKIIIERAGDVIPYIVKALDELRTGKEKPVEFPTHCPSCDTELVRSEEQAAWRCPNSVSCDAQVLQRIIFHVSKGAMNIDGFGKSYVEKFYELGWIKDIADVYKLDYNAIAQLEGFGEKSATNMKAAIDKAKSNPLYKLLVSLSIHHLGIKASKLIAQNISSVFDLKDWNLDTFTEIKDIGPVVAENVMAYFNKDENIQVLEKMASYGVNVNQTEEDKPLVVSDDAPLAGKTILFTGTLTQLGRKEAQSKAEKAGAKNISAVSSNLNILVVGEKAGSKLRKAQALETVQILTEQEFLDLVNQA
ncbi:MAG: NAD-dependent DNA ligase LigA [Saprospiraceae bacterium]|nr:NAD-dependent DNA ligase LigA [Saprospiraceae bacterium]